MHNGLHTHSQYTFENTLHLALSKDLLMSTWKNLDDYQAYLFDLDGTLIDTTADIAMAINHVRQVLQLSTLSQDQVAQGIGNGATYLLQHCFPDHSQQDIVTLREQFIDYYESHLCVHTRPYPNADQCLKQLKQQHKKVALVTNKPFHLTQPLLDHLQWNDYFDSVIGGDSLHHKKPHPLPITETLSRLQVDADQALFIGDTEVDAEASQRAGVMMVAIPYGRVCDDIQAGRWASHARIATLDQLVRHGM